MSLFSISDMLHRVPETPRTGMVQPAPGEAARVLVSAPTPEDTAEVSFHLLAAGCRVSTACALAEALPLLQAEWPALWLLDSRLLPPDRSAGIALHQWLRGIASGVALILVFPSESTIDERLDALEGGADDVVVRPLQPREVLLRMQAVLQRARPAMSTPATPSALTVDERAHEVRVHGVPVHVTPNEFALLHLFVRNAGRLLTYERLKAGAWGNPRDASDHAVRERVSRLRARLGAVGSCIETVRGSGFRFQWPPTEERDRRDDSVAR
jgi:DNA-binding response OmpR family regulator